VGKAAGPPITRTGSMPFLTIYGNEGDQTPPAPPLPKRKKPAREILADLPSFTHFACRGRGLGTNGHADRGTGRFPPARAPTVALTSRSSAAEPPLRAVGETSW